MVFKTMNYALEKKMLKADLFLGFKLIAMTTGIAAQIPLYSKSSERASQPIARTRSLIQTDYSAGALPGEAATREVPFINDLGEIVELDLVCQHNSLGAKEQECLAHFKQRPITIRAEKEYLINDGDEINIETKRTWELSINRISNEALLSLKTFRDLVIEHFMPKKRIPNFMDDWIWTPYNQAKLFIYQKLLAPLFKIVKNKEATTTITILTDIREYKSVRCSDIILDLDKLHSEGKLVVDVNHEDLFNMHVTIKPKLFDSLPNSFF
jgi:hypothetical protein